MFNGSMTKLRLVSTTIAVRVVCTAYLTVLIALLSGGDGTLLAGFGEASFSRFTISCYFSTTACYGFDFDGIWDYEAPTLLLIMV